jgi:hypothetical protein
MYPSPFFRIKLMPVDIFFVPAIYFISFPSFAIRNISEQNDISYSPNSF